MTKVQWAEKAGKMVIIETEAGARFPWQLEDFLGCGGAGAVYSIWDMDWVIKILDPGSSVAKQELKSIRKYRNFMRFSGALMKFHSWQGTLVFEEEQWKKYPCYFMPRGKSLKSAVSEKEAWLEDPEEVLRLAAFLVCGVWGLKNTGLSHGDIKEDNVLLIKYKPEGEDKGTDTFFPMLADYGTVAEKKTRAKSILYECEKTEYDSALEERIALDLYCIRRIICNLYGLDVNNPIIPRDVGSVKIRQFLRIIRDTQEKAFVRLARLVDSLKDQVDIPVSFFLDAVPFYDLKELPFETVMEWGNYRILRDRNVPPGEVFDPLLLMPIPKGRYENVYHALVTCNQMERFVMPICRCFDRENDREYVLVHAPDDRERCSRESFTGDPAASISCRIKDAKAIPLTLADPELQEKWPDLQEKWLEKEMGDAASELGRLKVDVDFSAKDIWHMDGKWKINLFSVGVLGPVMTNAK